MRTSATLFAIQIAPSAIARYLTSDFKAAPQTRCAVKLRTNETLLLIQIAPSAIARNLSADFTGGASRTSR